MLIQGNTVLSYDFMLQTTLQMLNRVIPFHKSTLSSSQAPVTSQVQMNLNFSPL